MTYDFNYSTDDGGTYVVGVDTVHRNYVVFAVTETGLKIEENASSIVWSDASVIAHTALEAARWHRRNKGELA
jgi:hypothetical protein